MKGGEIGEKSRKWGKMGKIEEMGRKLGEVGRKWGKIGGKLEERGKNGGNNWEIGENK